MAVTEYVKNLAMTSLSAAISTVGATSCTVVSASTFPSSASYRIRIDDEIMLVTAGAGTTTWTISRGQEGTTAATHSNGALVYGVLTAGGIDHFVQQHTHIGGIDGSTLSSRDSIYNVSISTNCTGSTLDTGGVMVVLNPSGAALPTIGNKTSGDSTTVTLPTGSTNDLMILVARSKASGQSATLPSGWSTLYGPAAGTYGAVSIFYRIRRSGDTGFTLGGSLASGVSWGIVAISGVHLALPFAGAIRLFSTGSATLNFGSTDFGLPNSYRMAFIAAAHTNSTVQTWTAPTGWTETHDTYGVTFSYRSLTTGLATTLYDSVQTPFYESVLSADTSFGTSGTELLTLSITIPGKYLITSRVKCVGGATAWSTWMTTPYSVSTNLADTASTAGTYTSIITCIVDVAESGSTFSLGATAGSGTLTALIGTVFQAVKL